MPSSSPTTTSPGGADRAPPPQLWSLLRDHARQSLASALAVATLVRYGITSVTDAMVADLIARGQDAALHDLLADGAAGDVPREAWERFVQA